MSNNIEIPNEDTHFDKIEWVVKNLKKHKAPSPDDIQNEALQNLDIKITLWHLIKMCFNNGLVHSIWLKAIIYCHFLYCL